MGGTNPFQYLHAFYIFGYSVTLLTLQGILLSNVIYRKIFLKVYNVEDNFTEILNNWRKDIITDLEVVSESSSCSSGFREISRYYFPGMNHFCDCFVSGYRT